VRPYEVEVRVRLRVLAADEDEATRVVSEDAVERLTEVLDELQRSNPRLAGYRLQADELADELDF